MKDSQLTPSAMAGFRKYIKANNERFSTGPHTDGETN